MLDIRLFFLENALWVDKIVVYSLFYSTWWWWQSVKVNGWEICIVIDSKDCATGAYPAIKLRDGISINTSYILTLHKYCKVRELTHVLKWYQRDILGLAEVRWPGFSEAATDEGQRLCYREEEARHEHGMQGNGRSHPGLYT